MASCNNNSYSRTTYPYNPSTPNYNVGFEIYEPNDVVVAKYDAATREWTTLTKGSNWDFNTDNTQISFTSTPGINNGEQFFIYRCTDIDPLPAEFTAGDSIKAQDLNDNFKVLRHAIEDTKEQSLQNLSEDTDPQLGGDLDLNAKFLSGILKVKADSNNQGEIRLFCRHDSDDHSGTPHYASIKGPVASDFTGSSLTFRIPPTYGSDGDVLRTDGSGVTSWVSRLHSVVEDTTPQLGGDLDMNGNFISSGILGVKNQGSQSELRLYCENENAHYISLKAPAHSGFNGNNELTLPATNGSAGQVLKTDGSGQLDWVSVTSASGSGIELTDLSVDPNSSAGLTYNNSNGVFTYTAPTVTATDLNSISIDALSDVTSTGASTGDVLKWNGSQWTAQADNVGSGGGGGLTRAQATAISLIFS